MCVSFFVGGAINIQVHIHNWLMRNLGRREECDVNNKDLHLNLFIKLYLLISAGVWTQTSLVPWVQTSYKKNFNVLKNIFTQILSYTEAVKVINFNLSTLGHIA